MSLDSQFNQLNDKLQLLLKQQNRLKRENEKLRQELEDCKTKEATYQQRINELDEQVYVLKMSAGEMSEKDKKDFERKINQYIKEIDKCIAFLSQ